MHSKNKALESTDSSPRSIAKVVLIAVAFWLFAVVLAFWFGLGWFFLVGTIRRLVLAIPPVHQVISRVLLGKERSELQVASVSQAGTHTVLYYALQGVIILIWVLFTVFAFRYMNVRLIDIVLMSLARSN